MFGMAPGLVTGRYRVRIPIWASDLFLFSVCPDRLGPTKPPIQWIPGFCREVKPVGGVRLTSYRHLSGVVKNEWSHTFAQLYSVMAWAGENFNLMDAKEIRLEERG